MTIISRSPRQILNFRVDFSKSQMLIQQMVNESLSAEIYCTDGFNGYCEVDFPGIHKRNISNKNDTHNIESTNADLRHYIAGLRRRSKCFFRKLETLKSVLWVFVNAYNKFGEFKRKYFLNNPKASRDLAFNHTAYI